MAHNNPLEMPCHSPQSPRLQQLIGLSSRVVDDWRISAHSSSAPKAT